MARPATKSTALWVIRRLRSAGFEALLAGGCVRDMLMGRRSSDYDVATDATPRQVRRLFRHVLLVGAKFGVAMVVRGGRKVEVTTFRTDLSYSDGRRPDGVRFSTPQQDARRRDFTINGMFCDPITGEVIDYVGGQRDLSRRLVRTIGPPDERFAEDYLRMIRAVRFAVRFGFRIAPATAAAIRNHAHKITSISGERIFDELTRMLSSGSAAAALEALRRLRLAEPILPELFDPRALWAAGAARAAALRRRRDPVLMLAALTGELAGGTIRKIVRRWGASNELRDGLCFLARHMPDWRTAAELPLCQFKRLVANEHFPRLRALWRIEERRRTGRQTHARRIARRISGIAPGQIAPRPLLMGADLIAMGLSEGPTLGKILRAVYDAQLDEQVHTRKQARLLAERMIAGQSA